MIFLRFLLSKSFLKQLLLIGFTSVFLFFLVSYGLKLSTNHNRYLSVPDLEGVPVSAISSIMERENLRFEVIDSPRIDSIKGTERYDH